MEFLGRVWIWLKYTIFFFGFLVLASMVGCAVLLTQVKLPSPTLVEKPVLPEKFVLHVDLRDGIDAQSAPSFLQWLSPTSLPPTLQLIRALNAASTDERVQAVAINLASTPLTLDEAAELRASILQLRERKKFTVALTDSFGEIGGGNASYYLASAAEEIWLPPSGSLGLTGLNAEVPFARDLLNHIGLEPVFLARHEFKSGPSVFQDTAMSAPQRQNLQTVLDDMNAILIERIASARNIPAASLRQAMNEAPLSASVAQSIGLIDELGYDNDVGDALAKRLEIKRDDMVLVAHTDYAASLTPSTDESSPRVVVLDMDGEVVSGTGDGFDDYGLIFSQPWTDLITALIHDDDVKGVLVRINSPGGSYIAADQVWHELDRLAEKKPLAISMGDMAASGGYFIAAAGQYVTANDFTITGSIGVFAGKMIATPLMQKIGINWQRLDGPSAGLTFSPNQPFSADEVVRLNLMLDDIYSDFTTKVANARKLDAAQIDAASRGRIFSASGAKIAGLIDDTGGYAAALNWLAQQLKVDDASKLALMTPHSPLSLLDELQSFIADQQLTPWSIIAPQLPTQLAVRALAFSALNPAQAAQPSIWAIAPLLPVVQ